MLRKKRGAFALLNHGSLALSVCCGWRKKKEAFWFKYFWGAKGKQKHRRRAAEGEAVSTCLLGGAGARAAGSGVLPQLRA